jgi:hypothetical protein
MQNSPGLGGSYLFLVPQEAEIGRSQFEDSKPGKKRHPSSEILKW